jgi:hypothetical protein
MSHATYLPVCSLVKEAQSTERIFGLIFFTCFHPHITTMLMLLRQPLYLLLPWHPSMQWPLSTLAIVLPAVAVAVVYHLCCHANEKVRISHFFFVSLTALFFPLTASATCHLHSQLPPLSALTTWPQILIPHPSHPL